MSTKFFSTTFAVTLTLIAGTLGKAAAQPSDHPSGQAAAVGGGGRNQETPALHVLKLPQSNLAPVPPELTRPIGIAPKNRPIVEKLQSRRLSLDVREVPLADIVANVRDQVGINVLLDRPALEEEGINGDTPVTARLMDAPLGQGLARLLEPFNLTYIVTHGVILITSKLTADNELILQVYPVADLVWMEDPTGRRSVDLESLIMLLEQTVAPNSWSVVGGAGTIRPFSGNLSLAILQTESVHQQIMDVIDLLRQSRGHADQAAQPARARKLPKPATHPTSIGIKGREAELLRAVSESIVSLSFVEVPLADVVKFLSDNSRLPFELDRPALEEEGITADTPITIQVSNVSLDDALYLFLGQYNLTWWVKSDVVVVTSKLTADNELRTLSYPVADLVVLSDGHERWSVFQCELIELIQDAVSPNSWTAVGGAGTIRYFATSQCLTVNQTHEVHQQLAELLAMLRESSDRLPEFTRAAGMPGPEKLAEARLRQARAESQHAIDNERAEEKRAAEAAEREAEEAKDLELGRRRTELQLLKALVRHAEGSAAKSEAELNQLKAKSLTSNRDMTKPPGPEMCPHCNKPIGK